MPSRVDISGGGPPTPAEIHALMLREGTRVMNEVTGTVHQEVLRRMAPERKTGSEMRSVWQNVLSDGQRITGQLGGGKVAFWHEYGTGLYGPKNAWIVPKTSRFLVFPARGGGGRRGRMVYARRVRGMRPRRHFRDAGLIAQGRVNAIHRKGAARIARGIEDLHGRG